MKVSVKINQKASEADKKKAKTIFFTMASIGLAFLLSCICIGLMFWLMK